MSELTNEEIELLEEYLRSNWHDFEVTAVEKGWAYHECHDLLYKIEELREAIESETKQPT